MPARLLHCLSSASVFLVFLWADSVSGVCVSVCLQVTLLTESSRRLTSFPQVDYTVLMVSVSQLHDNFLSRPLCWSILEPLKTTYEWSGHWNLHQLELYVEFNTEQNVTQAHCGSYRHLKYACVWRENHKSLNKLNHYLKIYISKKQLIWIPAMAALQQWPLKKRHKNIFPFNWDVCTRLLF